ncbi:MAG: protein kinase [Bryobacteraceae bacterium]|jgi:serine/threonine protein kinase/tetratricopeptide (TPR) repeat protein
MMKPERWQQIERLYHAALEREKSARPEFLANACAGDPELLREVESLLALETQADGYLEERAMEVAARALAHDQARSEKPLTGQMVSHPVSHFRIVRKIGEGGMGVVYEAWDERLGRAVAIKTIRGTEESEQARKQLWREARSLARVSHPHICQLFDAGEDGGTLFLVLELLEGQSLADRLASGSLPVSETVQITREILEALTALHGLQIVHRDLKPSNVFLTPHGVKLLDFGLARSAGAAPPGDAEGKWAAATITAPGRIAGTPRYMAPEQVGGLALGPAADIFAAGCVLYEMLAGRQAFDGASPVDVLYAVMHHNPPPLAGSREVEALDQVIRRAMAKHPQDRYATAGEMLDAVSAVLLSAGAVAAAPNRTVTRLIALPFRVLRKDEETDFLAYSLPDAIGSSLSGADGIVVRSTLVAARFEGPPDPRRIAVEADVDAILAGSLMRVGDQMRLTFQLVEAPGGAIIWSDTVMVSMEDLFQLQDQLSKRIAQSLMLPLSEREHRILRHDRPATARAYEYYLRANQIGTVRTLDNMRLARSLYAQCLEEDPQYAPAWAQLGRAHRFIEKFGEDADANLERAGEAFRKAFALNPDLSIAHNLYTTLECDQGGALAAMLRLLERARFRRNDTDLFAGLVPACRYCDELEASIAAHHRARHLDPHAATSVAHTYFMLGDYRKTLECYRTKGGIYLDCAALVMLGDNQKALALLRAREQSGVATGSVRAIIQSLRAYLEGDFEACLHMIEAGEPLTRRDPESFYYTARHLAQIQERERALKILSRVIDSGFLCGSALSRDPWLASLRSLPGYSRLLETSDQRCSQAHASFLAAGGPELLNLT